MKDISRLEQAKAAVKGYEDADIIDTAADQEDVEIVAYDKVPDGLRGVWLHPDWETIPQLRQQAEMVPQWLSEGRAILTDDTVFVRNLVDYTAEVGIAYNMLSERRTVRVYPAKSAAEVQNNIDEVKELKIAIGSTQSLSKEVTKPIMDRVEQMLLQTVFDTHDEDTFVDNLSRNTQNAYLAVITSDKSDGAKLQARLDYIEGRLMSYLRYLNNQQ